MLGVKEQAEEKTVEKQKLLEDKCDMKKTLHEVLGGQSCQFGGQC